MTSRQPSILIVAAKWWHSSARLAIALIRNGCRVGALCPPHHPLEFVSGVDPIFPYHGIRSFSSLRRSLLEWRPDIVIPCDDGVVAQLHELHREEPGLRDLIERSIGAPDGYPIVSSRFQLLATARSAGIRVPKTDRVTDAKDLVAWHQGNEAIAVLKVDGESGGNGVRISRSVAESLSAWRELSAYPTAAHAWKRFAIDRDPLAIWRSSTPGGRDVTVQEFIAGRPANSMLVCRQGTVIAQACVLVVASDGPTGAAMIIRPINDKRIAQAGELLVEKLQLSGFFGLDFMIENGTGNPYLIELNPRCTQLGHLELAGQGSLAGAFSAYLKGEPHRSPSRPIRSGPIALFPQAFGEAAAHSAHLDSSYQDIPWEEPKLVRELRRPPWPVRQWPSRLYHLFRPVTPTVPLEFEDAGPIFSGERHRAVS